MTHNRLPAASQKCYDDLTIKVEIKFFPSGSPAQPFDVTIVCLPVIFLFPLKSQGSLYSYLTKVKRRSRILVNSKQLLHGDKGESALRIQIKGRGEWRFNGGAFYPREEEQEIK